MLPADYAATGREIGRRAEVTHPLENRALGELAAQGIVRRDRIGRADTYRLNGSHALADLVCETFRRERGMKDDLLSFLRAQIQANAPSAREAYLFGSAARGAARANSDIDVAVVWPDASSIEVERASEAISEAIRERYGNRGQVLIRTSLLSGKTARGAWRQVLQNGISLLTSVRARRG